MVNRDNSSSSRFSTADIERCIRILKKIDFELAYLALLTCEGIKPLSRWEKQLDDGGLEALREMGLLARQVRRTTGTGREVFETVFGRTPACIQLYENRFEGRPIDKSPETQLFEGFLFGYPPCCIKRFISHPYAPNGLNTREQEILFHWACKDCKITPLLTHAYARVHTLICNY